jgi:hypothetical protein
VVGAFDVHARRGGHHFWEGVKAQGQSSGCGVAIRTLGCHVSVLLHHKC